MKYHLLQKGETLLELLLYMGLLSILLVIMLQIFSSILDVQSQSQVASDIQIDGKFLIQRLSYDIQRATAITLPATQGQSGTTLQLTISGMTYTYTILNKNLVLSNNVDTNASLNGYDDSVSNLTFTRVGNPNGKNTIQIVFSLTSNTIPVIGAQTETFQTTVAQR